MTPLESILQVCSGVKVERVARRGFSGRLSHTYEFRKVGEIELSTEGIFIEITATATKGTIAKVVGLDSLETYHERYSHNSKFDHDNRILTYGCTIIYEVEGRKQQGRIGAAYTKILSDQPTTKYVRTVKNHKKEKVKNPVNKYKQELQRGDWVIGVRQGRSLGIGRISRWTNSNVWGVMGDDLNDKTKEFKFDSISETFTMPNDEHVGLLTMAVLKGWKGR